MSKDAWTRKRYPRFTKGDVVKLTHHGIAANIVGRGSLIGIVTSTPERSTVGRMSVNVRRVDQKRQGRYWAGFWRHATAAEKATVARESSR